MKSILLQASALAIFVQGTFGQQSLWGQCGGIGWTGPTSCVSGACCVSQNPYYSQCLSGNCNGGGVTTTMSTTTRVVTTSGTATTTRTTTTTTTGGNTSATVLSPGCGKAATLTSGTKSMTVNGKTRQYILRVPNNYNPNTPYKLIFGYHWLGGSMQDVVNGGYYGLQSLAGETAIFVAPNGISNGWANSGGEDVTFFDQMLQTVESGLCVNQKRRFSAGWSYGGAMSFSLACSRASILRAVAVLSGAQLSGCSGGNDPMPYLGIHGTHDSVLDISLGRTLRDKFVKNNGCTAQSPPEPGVNSGIHIKTQYSGCRAGYPVTWIAHDGDHTPSPTDRGSSSSWAPAEIWSFFNQF
ncbi:hypothetical protein H072_34 [Dactylellina haptotyla CBS 200.50]|uniref:Feruloyl esterase C n=1 Tax=Dactylellina haptotyla (strain CBS 200.50) TaxID=1284197 RepID=S8CEA7_DACHA|nr:hypothetical protein H072_34 [Dactylellina haptotyla CBS 200.50]